MQVTEGSIIMQIPKGGGDIIMSGRGHYNATNERRDGGVIMQVTVTGGRHYYAETEGEGRRRETL